MIAPVRVPCPTDNHNRHCRYCHFYGKLSGWGVMYTRTIMYVPDAWFYKYRARWSPTSMSAGFLLVGYGKGFRTLEAAEKYLQKERRKLERK